MYNKGGDFFVEVKKRYITITEEDFFKVNKYQGLVRR